MRFIHLILVLVGGLGLGLVGCTPSSSESTDGGYDDVIRRGNIEHPETLDPVLVEDVHAFNILIDLYEGLVAEDARGQLVAGVAESWSTSEDGLTYTFNVRPNARWSNGLPVTSHDFVRAFRRAASPGTLSSYASLLSPIVNFDLIKGGDVPVEDLGVVANDDLMLSIQLRTPSAYFLGVLAMPVAFPLYKDGSNRAQFQDPEQFVGNGAYVLTRHELGNVVALRRSTNYWNKDNVATEFIEYLAIVNEVSEFNMYRAGELDITAAIPTSYINQAKETFSTEVRIAPTLAMYYLAFDLTEPPLDNLALRKSLSMAVDRERLVSVLGRGEQPAYSIVPPGVANYVSSEYSWQTISDQERLAQAQQLYNDAGYDKEKPLKLKLLYDAGGVHEKIALAVSGMWQEALGATIELDKREWKYFLDTRENREEWQVMRFSWFGDYNDPSTFTDIFQSDSPQNLSRYSSEQYDELIRAASNQMDLELRADVLAKAESTLLNDYPIVPLYFFVSKHMVKSDIVGFEKNILDRHPSQYLQRRE